MGDFNIETQRIYLWCTVAQMVISSKENSSTAVEAADSILKAFDEQFNPQGKVNNV